MPSPDFRRLDIEEPLRMHPLETPDGIGLDFSRTPKLDSRSFQPSLEVMGRATSVQAEDRVFAARAEERARLAGELHDGLGQTLVAAGLQLAALKRALPQDTEIAAIVGALSASLQQAQTELRTLAYAQQPPWIEGPNGFEGALREFVEGFARRAGITQDVELIGSPVAISPASQLALFRTLQEALVNVHRHAQADHVRVRLEWGRRAISLSIQDNGAGLAGSGSAHHRGVGLSSMRARLSELGGGLDVVSGSGGTTLAAKLPVEPKGRRAGIQNVDGVQGAG
jgi:signal transduction histidine kinase